MTSTKYLYNNIECPENPTFDNKLNSKQALQVHCAPAEPSNRFLCAGLCEGLHWEKRMRVEWNKDWKHL